MKGFAAVRGKPLRLHRARGRRPLPCRLRPPLGPGRAAPGPARGHRRDRARPRGDRSRDPGLTPCICLFAKPARWTRPRPPSISGSRRADLVFLSFTDSDLGAAASLLAVRARRAPVAAARQSRQAPPSDVGRSLCRAGDRARPLRDRAAAGRARLLALRRRGGGACCPRRRHSLGAPAGRRA